MNGTERIIVIKYGGHAMDIPEIKEAFFQELRGLIDEGFKFVITHGGGPQIARLLDRLGIKSSFENGLRVTDAEALEAVEMALCGQVNKEVVRFLEKSGIPAAGISGEDGPTLLARQKDPRLGRVGEVAEARPDLALKLLEAGYTPVIAPLGVDGNFEPLNINADTAAGAVAGALKADFVLLSDVPGVLDGAGRIIQRLDEKGVLELKAEGVISGGMIPKTRSCLDALSMGAREAVILDGREKNSLRSFLSGGEIRGTVISR